MKSHSLSPHPHQLFSDVAYKARDREDLIAGIDEFLDEVIVLPPGEWDPKIRIEPPKKVPSADKRLESYQPQKCTEISQLPYIWLKIFNKI